MHKYDSAFSLIEVVFTIVILGIVASVGMNIVSHLYASYAIQRSSYAVNQELDVLMAQLGNRLKFAIKETVVARVDKTGAHRELLDTLKVKKGHYRILQWVSYDFDGIQVIDKTDRRAGWSGRADINRSFPGALFTVASNLDLENRIIKNLSSNSRGVNNAYLYFNGSKTGQQIVEHDSKKSLIYVESNTPVLLHDEYKLAWTSYAIELQEGILYLYYSMTPAFATNLSKHRSIIAKDISSISIQIIDDKVYLEACMKKQIEVATYTELCRKRYIQ